MPSFSFLTRSFLVIAAALLVVAGLVSIKIAQIATAIGAGQAMSETGPPPEAVAVQPASTRPYAPAITAAGTLTGERGVVVANPVPGTVVDLTFVSGQAVRRGQVLARLDTRVEQARLEEAVSDARLAQQTVERARPLHASGGIAATQLDAEEAALRAATARVEALQAEIEQKTVRAPFDGRLGIREVDVGQYLPSGTPMTTLESAEGTHVDFSVSQRHLTTLELGQPVQVSWPGRDDAVEGTVTAISPTIDQGLVAVRARLPEVPSARPGMYVSVALELPPVSLIAVPTTAMAHASYGTRVFVVAETDGATRAQERFVEVVAERGDVAWLSGGVAAGEPVVHTGAFKLYDGVPVLVTDSSPTPVLEHPELPER